MKITAFPLYCLLSSTTLSIAARAAPAVSPVDPAASECKAQAEQFQAQRITAANLAEYKGHSSRGFVSVDFLQIGPNYIVPVFTMPTRGGRAGPDDATLIVLLHNKADSTSESPVVDAICHDQNHSFAIDKTKASITFASNDHEHLYLRFRLDSITLPNTVWKSPAADAVDMVPYDPNTQKPTGAAHWCGPAKYKDVKVKGTDMWFTMCKHYGQTRFYKYSLYMIVSGMPVDIDPIIVHEPQ